MEAEEEYNSVVYSFLKSRGQKSDTKEKKIFFGVYYFEKDKAVQKVFKDHGLLTVPYLTVSEMDLKRAPKT